MTMPAPSAQRASHVELVMELTWRYSSGAAMERFCLGLRERRIEALRCDRCGRRQLPPRPMCGDCRARMSSWVRVADQGALVAWTVVHVPATDGRTGRPRAVPYAMGLVRLDGADTTLNHFLRMPEPAQPPLALGARMRAVWRPDRRGAIDDIVHFEVMP